MALSVVVSGASGFLGTHLRTELLARGHAVISLVRRPTRSDDESRWDPYAGDVDRSLIRSADAVVNLAGSPTVGNPHSKKWARELRRSRVTTTRVLAETIGSATTPPAFLAGSGIAYYGDRGAQELTESADSQGDSTLTQVTRDVQAATAPAEAAGARVCHLRTAPVMDADSAPLKQLRLLFKAGLGGRLGDGRQRMPMISLRDWVGGVVHLIEHPDVAGPVNLCCPETPTNAEFTDALARAVERKAFLPAPAAAIRLGAGRMAPELLGSVNAYPKALLDAGYMFRDRTAADVVAAGLS